MSHLLDPGTWERRTETDEPTATLVVRSVLDGTLQLTERADTDGRRSLAATFVDPSTGDWVETRVGDDGSLVETQGPVTDGAVNATGRAVTSSGATQGYRQTLAVEEDGAVRVSEATAESADAGGNGAAWTSTVEAQYVRTGDAPPAPEPAATRSEHAGTDPAALPPERRFDFWVGTWDVSTVAGDPAGHNVIEPALGGAVLVEHWESAGGGAGKSLNCYDAAADEWLQTWVDTTGGTIVTRGRFVDGAMRQSGTLTEADGTQKPYRGTWTPEADGTVTQLLETSPDAGETFEEWFHGTYVAAAE